MSLKFFEPPIKLNPIIKDIINVITDVLKLINDIFGFKFISDLIDIIHDLIDPPSDHDLSI